MSGTRTGLPPGGVGPCRGERRGATPSAVRCSLPGTASRCGGPAGGEARAGVRLDPQAEQEFPAEDASKALARRHALTSCFLEGRPVPGGSSKRPAKSGLRKRLWPCEVSGFLPGMTVAHASPRETDSTPQAAMDGLHRLSRVSQMTRKPSLLQL